MDLQAQFSKKTSMILVALSIIGLVAGTALVLFSNNLLQIMFGLVENILHRSLNPEKWNSIFSSFALIPIFIVIFINAIIFVKYPPKTKIILLSALLADIVFMIIMMHTKAVNIVNSDDAGEMMLWRECALAKSFMPRSWGYSSEIRILNTQIFGMIFFSIFSDWTLIKLLVSLCSLAVLFFATLFLLDKIGIKEFWKKFFCTILIIAPSSSLVWRMITFGNYYIPHIAISFFYIGLFLDLQNNSIKYKKAKITAFMLLAFCGGGASIRYPLTIFFPLALLTIMMGVKKSEIQKFNIREFFIKDTRVFYGFSGFFISGIGYVGNSLLHIFYDFESYSNTKFSSIASINLFRTLKMFPGIFGYSDNVGALTVSGIINIFVCVFIVLFVSFLFNLNKINLENNQDLAVNFLVVNFIFNTFVFFVTDVNESRYYLPITIYVIVCAVVFIFSKPFDKIKRFVLGVTVSTALLVSSFTVSQSIINSGETHHAKVATFLEQNYTFGYATFWNADVTTFLTNGKVDVGFIGNEIPNSYSYSFWLSPKRYYTSNFKNDEKIFFLVTQDEFIANNEKQIFASGKQVFEDEFFRVFEYANHDAFRNGF